MKQLASKEKFINRDLSWLAFNERVLEEAEDKSNPLLERVKFLAIFANNIDEFFMVRLASAKRLIDAEYHVEDFSGYYPQELLDAMQERISELYKRFYHIYLTIVTKQLEKNNIFVRSYESLTTIQKRHVKKFFETTLYPIITPMAIDEGRPFPNLSSKTMAFVVELNRYNKPHFAIITVPKNVPRVLKLPSEKDMYEFILIEEVIRHNLEKFFQGFKIEQHLLFRLMRDSELLLEEEFVPNILKAIAGELKRRPQAQVVWLEVEKSSSQGLLEFLIEGLQVPLPSGHKIEGPLDLTFLFGLARQVSKPDLFYPSFTPAKKKYENIFERIQMGDMLVNLPYESFDPTVDLIREAAKDDNVLAIKMTLYRTTDGSPIVEGLKEAAQAGKQVTVLVEIKARFDEERNIKGARELEEAGCHVMHGIAGVKVHAKLLLIVRKEEGRIRRYVHISTGNYNEKTAKIYTDVGYFTCNDDVAKDVSDVFNVITGYSMPNRLKRIVTSPNDMKGFLFRMIQNEIEWHRKNGNGLILAKMNSLEDPEMIEKLYEASQAGVKIKLMVRGICCLVPGVKDLSENIQVRSLLGRYLEHARMYFFHNNGEVRVFISSADWMRRNLDDRIECLFEIFNQEIKDKLHKVWDIQWKDEVKARKLKSDRLYHPVKDPLGTFNAQEALMEYFSSNGQL